MDTQSLTRRLTGRRNGRPEGAKDAENASGDVAHAGTENIDERGRRRDHRVPDDVADKTVRVAEQDHRGGVADGDPAALGGDRAAADSGLAAGGDHAATANRTLARTSAIGAGGVVLAWGGNQLGWWWVTILTGIGAALLLRGRTVAWFVLAVPLVSWGGDLFR
ncbi:MAG: hypothetical protein HOV83_26830, partial [Catenulispora sp.]|nr:hypothetical protein [Catenulispora sp.]